MDGVIGILDGVIGILDCDYVILDNYLLFEGENLVFLAALAALCLAFLKTFI